jgi:5-methylcytosine-specific restriction endonuclease McrA
MSRKLADRYTPLSPHDHELLRLQARLAALRREWNDTAPCNPSDTPRRIFDGPKYRKMKPPASGWRLALWIKQYGTCAYCRRSLLPRYHVDHIIPRSKGGPSHPDNYAFACESCNLAKSAQDADTFRHSLR